MDEKTEEKEQNKKYFPYKTIFNYLKDIELREKLAAEQINHITRSRLTIEQFLAAAGREGQ